MFIIVVLFLLFFFITWSLLRAASIADRNIVKENIYDQYKNDKKESE